MGSRNTAPFILHLGARWGLGVNAMSLRLDRQEGEPVLALQEAGWISGHVCDEKKASCSHTVIVNEGRKK
jgi:hypothetical protein